MVDMIKKIIWIPAKMQDTCMPITIHQGSRTENKVIILFYQKILLEVLFQIQDPS